MRRELRIFAGIIPLVWRDLSAQWNPEVTAVDASEWGLGATTTTLGTSTVAEFGKFSERWRFESEKFRKPRSSVFGCSTADTDEAHVAQWAAADGGQLEATRPLLGGFGENKPVCFDPIPIQCLQTEWKVVGRYTWKRVESMPVLEARATLHAVKHFLRRSSSFHCKHLILSDSMSAICAIERGRGKTF